MLSTILSKGEQKSEKYRPISLMSVPSKLMEQIIRDALVQHTTQTYSQQLHMDLCRDSYVPPSY